MHRRGWYVGTFLRLNLFLCRVFLEGIEMVIRDGHKIESILFASFTSDMTKCRQSACRRQAWAKYLMIGTLFMDLP